MATPWLRIEDKYRAYLEAAGYSADDFNDPSFKRADTFNAFNAFKQQQQQQQQQHEENGAQSRLPVLPPRTPQMKKRQRTAPPSSGKKPPRQKPLRKSPSSEEGKLEGLDYASSDENSHMQCTSTPACVALLSVLENAIEDQQKAETDNDGDKYFLAAKHVIRARRRLLSRDLPEDIGTNERFFTGAMANAMNSVLQDGYCVLHQACLGTGATHSDLSATRIRKDKGCTTLMVGEGRWNACDLRQETRGQIFNELIRHRTIDKAATNQQYGPILLLAFDQNKVEIDLAFPSTRGGKLAKDHVVDFRSDFGVVEEEETFWTVRLARMSIEETNGMTNLPIVLRFISDALMKLDTLSLSGNRVQQKTPMPLTIDDIATVTQYCGENVTVIEDTEGSTFVYKEYCYHLRQESSVMSPFLKIKESDKRRPPPKELLKGLGPPYSEWEQHDGPFGASVLRYSFIEGSSHQPSVDGWKKILFLVKKIHEINFVHGDLLPRNVVFGTEGEGYLIDFDLSRKEGETYVAGYNYEDFRGFRHDGAKAGEKMSKEHDVHSVHQMSRYFFDVGQSDLNNRGLDQLIEFFNDNPGLSSQNLSTPEEEASGSPQCAFE